MHEIITLQIGSQACFAGTHFWNAQESYFTYGEDKQSPVDHNIHFQEGKAQDGSDTFTPRVLIYDFKPAFGTLRQQNALYHLENEENLAIRSLGNAGSIIREQQIPPHPYQVHLENPEMPGNLNLDNVRFWSDYNRVFYHPRSLIPINTNIAHTQVDPTSVWDAEGCDQMQGVMVMVDVDNAWGGFGSRYVETLRDELNKSVIMVWGLEKTVRLNERTSEQVQSRLQNSIRSVFGIASKASLYCPLTSKPQHLSAYTRLHAGAPWHTSALQVTAIETLTLPSRLHKFSGGAGSLGEIEQFFTARDSNRKLLRADMTLNGNFREAVEHVNGNSQKEEDSNHSNVKEEPNPDIIMMPELSGTTKFHVFNRVDVRRGSVYTESVSTGPDDNIDPMVRKFGSDLAYPLLDSFPGIFNASNDDTGSNVYASISSDSRVSILLRDYARLSRRLLPLDEREDVSNELQTWAEGYVEGWESDEEEDWDD